MATASTSACKRQLAVRSRPPKCRFLGKQWFDLAHVRYCPSRPLQGAIQLEQGKVVTLTCDKAAPASSSVLPVSTLTTFEGQGLLPGSSIFVGQVCGMQPRLEGVS